MMAKRKKGKSLVDEACKWASSPEGMEEIEKALEEAKKLIDHLKQAQLLDPRVLNEPITL